MGPSGKFLYVSGDSISVFSIDQTTGELTPIPGSPFSAGLGPAGFAMHPSGKFLLVGFPLDRQIAVYGVDGTTGALTAMQGSAFGSVPETSCSLALDPTGKFLYAVGDSDGLMYGYSVDSTSGALTPLAGSPFDSPYYNLGLSDLVIDPSGHFLYASGASFGALLSYQIDPSTGALTPITGPGEPTGEQQTGTYPPLGLTILQFP